MAQCMAMPHRFKVQSKQKANGHTQRINSFIPTRVCPNIRKTKIYLFLSFYWHSTFGVILLWHAFLRLWMCVFLGKKVNLKSATNLCKHLSIFLFHLLSTQMNINIYRFVIANRLENSNLIEFGMHTNVMDVCGCVWCGEQYADSALATAYVCCWKNSIPNANVCDRLAIGSLQLKCRLRD